MSKTFIGRVNWKSFSSQAASGILGVSAVALVALGVALIFLPAGIITAGVGCIALQWLFFGSDSNPDPGPDSLGNYRNR